jgi:signal transduction histidine kinase
MNDKKILFPLLLFGIFFVLIAITGFFQITIIKTNIERLLLGEGETLFKSITREIEVNMEYLTLIEKSPSIITPNFLNVSTYDEAIVDDLYSQLTKPGMPQSPVPFRNLLVTDREGRELERKGSIDVDEAGRDLLMKGDRQTVIRLPVGANQPLFLGVKLRDKLVFVVLEPDELETLRKMYVMKTIVENEEKRLSVAEINIYDESGRLYLGSGTRPKEVYGLLKPLGSRYFPNYSLEILMSNRLAIDTFRRTSENFIMLLFFLMLGGAGSIYVIFRAERKHAQRLKEIEKDMDMKERLVSLGRLSSGMAHEIRNPLNAIGMSIQRLKREFVPEQEKKEEYHKFLDIVRGELLRVNRIVEEFLLSTKSGMAMERQNLHTIVEEVVTMLREKASASDIRISNESDENATLDCQKERLKQVFYNLLVNGMEAMGKGGSITISSQTENSMIRVFIRDTGPGIKKADALRIFEYYYTTKDKGMGLGLPISYMIVKDHGGDIRVLGDEGAGATFVITLPVTNTKSLPKAEKPA